MGVAISIGGSFRQRNVLKKTFSASHQLESRRVCSFTAYDKSGWRPDVGDRVVVYVGYPGDVLAHQPVGYWRLNETSGTNANESSGSGVDGTYAGVTLGAVGPLSDGSTAVEFGNDDTHRVAITQNLNGITTAITIEGWVYADTLTNPNTHRMWWSAEDSATYASFNGATNARPFISLRISGTQRTLSAGSVPSTGTWYHVAATWTSGDYIRLYVNGELSATSGSTYSGTLALGSGTHYIGKYSGDALRAWDGRIAEVAIFSRALSATELAGRYAARTATTGYSFSGMVDDFQEELVRPGRTVGTLRRNYAIQCIADEAMCDRRHYADSHTSTPVNSIVADVCTEGLSGETLDFTTHVDPGPTLALANFNYAPVSDVFNDVATEAGMHWWFQPGPSPVLYFKERGNVLAPFALDSEAANPRFFKCIPRRHRENYRNKQIFQGGTGLTDARTELWKGDGATRVFKTGYPVAKQPTGIAVNSVAKTIAIGTVEEGTADFYWNEGEDQIRQDDAGTLLTSAQELAVTYQGAYPVVVHAQLDAEIAARAAAEGTSGIYEAKEEDSSVTDAGAAITRTNALLDRWGEIPLELSVLTHDAGLEVGQIVTVNMPELEIEGEFLVTDVAMRWFTKDRLTFQVTLASGDGVGGWIPFFRALMAQKGRFTIRENEVVLLSRPVADHVICSDSVLASTSAPESRIGFATIGYSAIG
jgi:hypothetical protein